MEQKQSAPNRPPAPAGAPRKLKVHFKAVGGAKMMKRNKFKLGSDKPWTIVDAFLRRQLQLTAQEPLFTYVSSAFCPSPDELVGNLHDCFQVGGELVIQYSITAAWG
jgi:ubiquitin-like protein ATG12